MASPVGAAITGSAISRPSTVVDISTSDTSTNARGWSVTLSNASRLRAAVTSSHAAPSA